jgi:hypothetical protein
MEMFSWRQKSLIALIAALIFAVSIILAIALVVILRKKRDSIKTTETNYRVFFIIGVGLAPTGLAWMVVSLLTELSITIGLPFFILGVSYLAIGLANRDKWNTKYLRKQNV